jgi:hypothetical protein
MIFFVFGHYCHGKHIYQLVGKKNQNQPLALHPPPSAALRGVVLFRRLACGAGTRPASPARLHPPPPRRTPYARDSSSYAKAPASIAVVKTAYNRVVIPA